MTFKVESEFEESVVQILSNKGWVDGIVKYPTEKDLIDNWKNILFLNNNRIDCLNDAPLTDTEMGQILQQIKDYRTPLKLNGFINDKYVPITRDNSNDKLHLGKIVHLKIYDRNEIAAGQSKYQIVQQPQFSRKNSLANDRRGDLMLLINGMPVIHIELKRSGVPVSCAYRQIEKYSFEGMFTGIYSLIQVFVAMTPEETVYFANPGPDGTFNKDYYFHWADVDNEPINEWNKVLDGLLSLPMAHQLVGCYTVADDTDGILKVMRSYQYYAANAISDKVAKTKWGESGQLGGYIWHTTGSGKTMTSFKSAQLISYSNNADKVVFLVDRIELATQSLKEYRGFASDSEDVQATENTYELVARLKSDSVSDTLIVTSIQKMSNIKDDENGLNEQDISKINDKRLVFIIDEAHRSTFGEMLITIKNTFKNAIFFGFTGTPIHEENQKKMNTTASVFGNELHRYSIADGIRDKNVLGFDTYKVLTFKDIDLRRAVALEKAKAKNELEAISDPSKEKVYYEYMDSSKVPMYGYKDDSGKYIKGIEDYIPKIQYKSEEHKNKVIEDIKSNWLRLSRSNKFHAIFATSSIPEAIGYYRMLKIQFPELKTTCVFDQNIDNTEGFDYKENGLLEIIDDYNKRFGQKFSISTFGLMKKDVANRVAHKAMYKRIEREPEKQLNMIIVVNQLLTGYDSKWINTLYLDKVLVYENLIQSFSRTNRLFGYDKPFGVIRYYRKPHTMENNIREAVKLYSGDKPLGLFVEKIEYNLKQMDLILEQIKLLFENEGIKNFECLPSDKRVTAKFVSLFNEYQKYLEAARIQGFKYEDGDNENIEEKTTVEIKCNEDEVVLYEFSPTSYNSLIERYKEAQKDADNPNGIDNEDIPYDIKGYITEIDTDVINSDYMNARFEKYLRLINQDDASQELIDAALDELHKSFASLNQEEQKYANIFLHDIQCQTVEIISGKSLRDYVTEYLYDAKNDQIHRFSEMFGIDESKLRHIMSLKLNDNNINEFGRLDDLKATVDRSKAKNVFETIEQKKLNPAKVSIKLDKVLRKFIIEGTFSNN